MTTAEQRAKLRSEAYWLQSDGGLRVMLLDEIEELSKALSKALDGWEAFAMQHPGGAPFNMAVIAELRKLVRL